MQWLNLGLDNCETYNVFGGSFNIAVVRVSFPVLIWNPWVVSPHPVALLIEGLSTRQGLEGSG